MTTAGTIEASATQWARDGARSASVPSRADLWRRLGRALDFALAVVDDFGTRGYVDRVSPALSFGPDKVVAEAAMLAYAAAGAVRASTDAGSLPSQLSELISRLAQLARSGVAGAELALSPELAFKRAVPHALLTAMGCPDRDFDALAELSCARVLRHGADQPPTVLAEREWVIGMAGWSCAGGDPVPTFTRPFDVLLDSREDAYGLTHQLFYLTDFGRRPVPAVPTRRVLVEVEALVARYLSRADYDLVAELLMAWPQLREPWSPTAEFTFGVLAEIEDEGGVLPAGNVDSRRLEALGAAERRSYARAATYHTALVMGLLCATALQADLGVASRVGPDRDWRRWFDYTADDGAAWRAGFDRADPATKAALVPLLIDIGLSQALSRRDIRAVADLIRRSTEDDRRRPLVRASEHVLYALDRACSR